MRNLLLTQFILTTFMFAQIDGEYVKNVTAEQRTDGSKIIDIYYDLEESDTYLYFDIYATGEGPDGTIFSLINCGGDVWSHIFPGDNKHIECQLATPGDSDTETLSDQFFINVHATASGSSDIPDDFNMIPIPSSTSYLIDYNFELMDKEITAVQYVNFLNSILSSAVSVENNDGINNYYNRIYTLENGNQIEIIANECDDNYYDGCQMQQGYVKGYKSIVPGPEGVYTIGGGVAPDNHTWLDLKFHTSYLNLPHSHSLIEFSSTAQGADDFSFIINEGYGNHPITEVSGYGADAFAKYYGMRIPFFDEYIAVIASLGSQDESFWEDNLNSWYSGLEDEFYNLNIDECNANLSCQNDNCDWDDGMCSTTPSNFFPEPQLGEFYDLFGNTYDLVIQRHENTPTDFGYWGEDNFLILYNLKGIGGAYNHYYSNWPWSGGFSYPYSNIGFRCARTTSGNNND